MGRLDDLNKLQNLKASGAISEEEFTIEKNKLLKNNKNKPKSHFGVILFLIIMLGVIVILCIILSNKFNNIGKNVNYYERSDIFNVANTNESSTNINNTQTNNKPLVGRHNIVYYNGFSDLSDFLGYLKLNENNTFKIYINYTPLNTEIVNIEGTYKLSGSSIVIKITKESGFDLGSQSREDTITIAQDNLIYREIKFDK